jgi:hypothetical protein
VLQRVTLLTTSLLLAADYLFYQLSLQEILNVVAGLTAKIVIVTTLK